jgi:quercetin dioxygenase-like cupin family protein
LCKAAQVPTGPGSHPAGSPFDKCIGDELGVTAFGLYQVELPAGAETVAHNHLADGAEDAYAVLRGTGTGTVIIDDREVPVVPGDFIAVTPESTRRVRAGEGGLVFIAVCAPTAEAESSGSGPRGDGSSS